MSAESHKRIIPHCAFCVIEVRGVGEDLTTSAPTIYLPAPAACFVYLDAEEACLRGRVWQYLQRGARTPHGHRFGLHQTRVLSFVFTETEGASHLPRLEQSDARTAPWVIPPILARVRCDSPRTLLPITRNVTEYDRQRVIEPVRFHVRTALPDDVEVEGAAVENSVSCVLHALEKKGQCHVGASSMGRVFTAANTASYSPSALR